MLSNGASDIERIVTLLFTGCQKLNAYSVKLREPHMSSVAMEM